METETEIVTKTHRWNWQKCKYAKKHMHANTKPETEIKTETETKTHRLLWQYCNLTKKNICT